MSTLPHDSPDGPDIAEDRRRYDEFERTRLAVSLHDVKAWVAGWGSADELPRPQPRDGN